MNKEEKITETLSENVAAEESMDQGEDPGLKDIHYEESHFHAIYGNRMYNPHEHGHEMPDRFEETAHNNKVDGWQYTPMKNYKNPRLTERMWKTPLVVLITAVIYKYLLPGRNPCFALIGAVYGIGSQFQEGFYNGFNRFVGTFVGGFLVIPFHYLYMNEPFGVPDWIWLVIGLLLVIWVNLALGADSAIQPGTVVYFVVLFTVGEERVLTYTLARILDTGIGVLISILFTMLRPTKADIEHGLSFGSMHHHIKDSLRFFRDKNRKTRKEEEKNFGLK